MNDNIVLVETTPPFASIALLPMDRPYSLGRSTQCDIVVNHSSVSRRHAEIALVDSSVMVRDLRSLNGTFIDNERVEQGELTIGHNLRLGNVSFILAALGLEGEMLDSGLETPRVASNKSRGVCLAGPDLAARRLSPAQLRVYQLLVAGLMEKTIAKQLSISPHTVHNHIRAIYTAFGVHSRSQLLAAELQSGHALRRISAKGTEEGVNPSRLGKGH